MTPALFTVGAVLLLAGAAVYITRWEPAPYLYTIGATLVALAQINTPVRSDKPNVRRLRRRPDIRCAAVGADRRIHVLYTWQRVDCVPHGGRHPRAIHRLPHPAGGGEGIGLSGASPDTAVTGARKG